VLFFKNYFKTQETIVRLTLTLKNPHQVYQQRRFRIFTLVNYLQNDFLFSSERSLFGGTRHVGCPKSKRRPTLGFGVHRRTDTHWMRIAMGFCRRSGLASDATYIDRQLQAVTNILRTQGNV